MFGIDELASLPGMKQPASAKRVLCESGPEAQASRRPPVLWAAPVDTVSGSNESHDHDVTRLVPSFASSQQAAPARSHGSAESPASACSDGSQDSTRASSQEGRPRAPRKPAVAPAPAPSQRRKTQRSGAEPGAGKWGPGGVKAPPAKKGRMTWGPDLHREFLAALTAIGLRAAVPKTIMQKMQCSTLTRENVASHLQKYRLFLKRQARVADAAVTAEADWALLEAAHDAHIAGLQPPLSPSTAAAAAPAVAAAAAAPAQPPAPMRIATAAPAVGESAGADAKPDSGRATVCGLPPMLPASAPSPATPGGAAALHRSNCGLPPGFAVPGPNAAGEAIGIPMPFHMFTATSAAAPGPADASRQASAACKGDAAAPPPALSPLALPDNPASLMPAAFEPEKLSQRLDEAMASSSGTALAQPTVRVVHGAAAGTPMCTVYMVDPGALSGDGRARTFLAPASVPHSMLEVSVAAYSMRCGQRGVPVRGSPVRANSTGSASRRELDSGDADTGASGRVRRRRTGRRSPRAGSGGARRMDAAPPAGDSSALDMLAEVAGRLSGGGD